MNRDAIDAGGYTGGAGTLFIATHFTLIARFAAKLRHLKVLYY